ncbi:MAG: transporter [Acidobacteriota bacterium]
MPNRRLTIILAALSALAVSLAAAAGPPFFTDDPGIVPYGHYELYLFSTLDSTSASTAVQAPAVEFNYGAAPNLMLHVVAPLAFASTPGGPTAFGPGDLELGLNYRFYDNPGSGLQISTFPMLELPTGSASRGLGNGRTWARLPVWLEKDWGSWAVDTGGGLAVNHAPGQQNYLFAGALLTRQLGEKWILGGELFTQGADSPDGRGFTIFTAGGFYNFRRGFSLLFTAGRSVAGEPHTVAYLGLYWTWGKSPGR